MQWVSYNCCATKITLMQCLQTCPSETLIAFIFFYTAIQLYTNISLRPLYMLIGEGEKCFPAKISISLQKKAMDISKTQSPDGNTIYVYKKGYSITIARQCCGRVANVVTYPGPCLVHRLYWCYTCYTIHKTSRGRNTSQQTR